jgi:hypothetical protein
MKGITYKETYPLKHVNSGGVDYLEVDFNNKRTTIYNKDFNLSREGYVSEVTSIPKGEIWNKKEANSSPVIKKEYLNHVSDEPMIDVDVEFDRGNATAFENHFKIWECNTFEDLENYGNNYFNL